MAERRKSLQILRDGLVAENPIVRHVLGICSALAVTNLLLNTLVLSAGVIFTLSMSAVTVSVLRNRTPVRIRMMVQTLIIASYVIIVDLVIKARLPEISEALGPYVGLIITNCIIMGRCEAYARNNPPWPSFLDALGTAVGFALVLCIIAVAREALGFGTVLGLKVMPEGFTPWTIMIMAPGAFFMLGLFVWGVRGFFPGIYEDRGPG